MTPQVTHHWTIVVDELDGNAEEAERLRGLLVATLQAAGQHPRTVTVESWIYREARTPLRRK